jgi:hypothetical protein
MDVEIKEFSLTILVGVAFVVSLILSIRLTVVPNFRIRLPHLFKIGSADNQDEGKADDKAEQILTFAHNIALVVVFLGLGLLLQDNSKSVVAQRSFPLPVSTSPVDWFVGWAMPPAEMTSRLEPFFNERAFDSARKRTWSPQREVAVVCDKYFRTRDASDAVNKRMPKNMEMSAFAKQVIPQLDLDLKRPVTSEDKVQSAHAVLAELSSFTDSKSTAKEDAGPRCEALLSVDYLYYRAKNLVFQHHEYFEELREIEGKLSFLRGMIFVVAITWLVYAFLAIVGAILLLTKVVTWMREMMSSGISLFGPTARSSAANALANARMPFFRHTAWLAVLLIGGFFVHDAYRAEQLNYNNRVYGYFQVLCLLGGDCLQGAKSE